MRDKKKIIIGGLCALVGIMAVGYAALATQLNISGTASIDSTWNVQITNITERDIVGDATSKVDPSYTATTANFSVGLIQPGDSITYDIEISNLGTLDARVGSIQVTLDENEAITYATTGIKAGDSLKVNEKDTLSVTVAYDSSVTSQPADTNKDISVTINYVQDLGENTPITYAAYSIGDVVSFAGSNWYVIQNSSSEEDYVTLLKQDILTHEELGDYAAYYTCTATDVTNATNGCTTEGQVIEMDAMAYYWGSSCHTAGYYGYTDNGTCYGLCDYHSSSKVRRFLEETYINTLGSENLKEVDNYKIRLIKLEELQNNLGFSTVVYSAAPGYSRDKDSTPAWVYDQNYWTMTTWPGTRNADEVGYVTTSGYVEDLVVSRVSGVRPVINLLKSSI